MALRALVALAGACVVVGFARPAPAADPVREVHGAADVFVAPGIALAWGVLRGATDAGTMVVVRIAVDPGRYAAVAALGRDPFTQQTTTLLPPTSAGRGVDLRVPRAHFADFPRTEFRFHEAAVPPPDASPKLVVYFLGVPDTTPEFASEAALDTYLADRLARARADAGSKPP